LKGAQLDLVDDFSTGTIIKIKPLQWRYLFLKIFIYFQLLNSNPNKGIEKAHDEDSYTIWFATSNGASLHDSKYVEFNHE
jgi:hypothetical protein